MVCGPTTLKASVTVKIGDMSVSTPFVISASVSRARGNMVTTASASFHINEGDLHASTGATFVIYFHNQVVFTGFAKRISIGPSFRCAGEQIIRIQGEDVLYKLENKNFTRRQKLSGLGPIAFISSLHKRTTVGFDDYIPTRYDINSTGSPLDILVPGTNFNEYTQLMVDYRDIQGNNHPVTKVADQISNPYSGGGGGSFILHSHETMQLDSTGGGPSVAVFSIK